MIKTGQAYSEAIINANIDSINISKWLFTISSQEYESFAQGHQSAEQGILPSGKRVSINVENVAGYFMIQHYVEKIAEKNRVLTISPNTVLWLDDENYVILQITWELTVQKIDDKCCKLTCSVTSETENEKFAAAIHERTKNVNPDESPFQLHIAEETPLFARDIEKKAKSGIWN